MLRFRECLFVVLAASLCSYAARAADQPESTDSLWGQIEFDGVQGRAAGIAGVQSIAFDNFVVVNDSNDNDLIERKVLAMNLPLKLAPSQTAKGLNADLRGFLGRSEGVRATLVFLVGNASTVVQYPPQPRGKDEVTTEDVLVSLNVEEVLKAGSSVPLTVLLLVQKPSAEGSVLFSIDSIDMALDLD